MYVEFQARDQNCFRARAKTFDTYLPVYIHIQLKSAEIIDRFCRKI